MKTIHISIIIPTYNSEKSLKKLLDSLRESSYQNFEVIINDSIKSTDHTKDVVDIYKKKGLQISFYKKNYSMAQGRKQASEYAKGNILMHLDSDMIVTKELLEECSILLKTTYHALVIPEEEIGTTFWAWCKWLEKKCYEGNSHIESLRVVKKSVYDSVSGHNPQMIFSEDRDLDLKVRKAGYRVGRTKNYIFHDEGALTLKKILSKKSTYSASADLFLREHPQEAKWQANIFNRYSIYLKNWRYFFKYPLLFSGMIFMKNLEYFFAGIGYLKKQ